MLTVEIGGADGIPAESWVGPAIVNGEYLPASFNIDYVRIYQYNK